MYQSVLPARLLSKNIHTESKQGLDDCVAKGHCVREMCSLPHKASETKTIIECYVHEIEGHY